MNNSPKRGEFLFYSEVAVGYAVSPENKSGPRGNSLLTKQYNGVANAIFGRAARKVECDMSLTRNGKSRMQAWGLPCFPFGYIVVRPRPGQWPQGRPGERVYNAFFKEYAINYRDARYLGECDVFGFPVEQGDLMRA